jgi:hypothetical protein
LSEPLTAATTPTPPQQSSARASTDIRTTVIGRRLRLPGGGVGCWAVGGHHGSCGLGLVTATPWWAFRRASMGRSCTAGRFSGN